MDEMGKVLGRWQIDVKAIRERMYGAPTTRERERWHAIWRMARGMTAAQVAEALERDAHTIGDWLETLREKGPTALAFEQSGGLPHPHIGTTSDTESSSPSHAERSGGEPG